MYIGVPILHGRLVRVCMTYTKDLRGVIRGSRSRVGMGLPGQSAKAVAAEAGAPYSRVAPETDAHGQGKTLPS